MPFFYKAASVNCDNKSSNQCSQFKRKSKKKNSGKCKFHSFSWEKNLKLSKSKNQLCCTVTQTEKKINTWIFWMFNNYRLVTLAKIL